MAATRRMADARSCLKGAQAATSSRVWETSLRVTGRACSFSTVATARVLPSSDMNSTSVVVAEVKKSECWLATAYYEDP